PTLASLVWFTVFGASGIHFTREGLMQSGDEVNSDTSLFEMFGLLPLGAVLSAVAIMVVVFFFVTSSDSGSLVIDMLACGGKVETPKATRVFWAILEGAVAAVLLVVGGDAALTALQTVAVSTAAPFSVILVLACFALYRAFRHDVATMPEHIQVLTPADAEEEPAEPLSTRLRREVRGLRGVSTSLGGLPREREEQSSAVDPNIVSYRPVPSNKLEFDPVTGRPVLADSESDPLAGEVFDTDEFQSSQEYVDMGGSLEHALSEEFGEQPVEEPDAGKR